MLMYADLRNKSLFPMSCLKCMVVVYMHHANIVCVDEQLCLCIIIYVTNVRLILLVCNARLLNTCTMRISFTLMGVYAYVY